MDPMSGTYKVPLPNMYSSYANFQYPFTGTSCMLPLYPAANYAYVGLTLTQHTHNTPHNMHLHAGTIPYIDI